MPTAEEVARGAKRGGSAGGKTRGSTDNSRRLAAFAEGTGKGDADWGDCDPARMQAVVVAICTMGGAVTFSLSRDQGAHSVTLLLDGDRQSLWYNGDADLNAELEKVLATLEAM